MAEYGTPFSWLRDANTRCYIRLETSDPEGSPVHDMSATGADRFYNAPVATTSPSHGQRDLSVEVSLHSPVRASTYYNRPHVDTHGDPASRSGWVCLKFSGWTGDRLHDHRVSRKEVAIYLHDGQSIMDLVCCLLDAATRLRDDTKHVLAGHNPPGYDPETSTVADMIVHHVHMDVDPDDEDTGT